MITILNKKLLEKQRVEPLWSLWGTHRALFYNVNATVSFENRLTLSTKTFFTGLTNWQTDRQAKTILNSFAHAYRIMKPNVYKMIHIANIQCTLVTSTPVFVKEMAEVHCTLGDSGILLNTIWSPYTLKKLLCHMTWSWTMLYTTLFGIFQSHFGNLHQAVHTECTDLVLLNRK